MVIGFDGSRAFVNDRTGTENYSYQLLKALSKIDRKNTYIVYIRPSSVILNEVKDLSLASLNRRSGRMRVPNKLGDSSLITQNDNYQWPKNFQFKTINWPRLWTQVGLAIQTFKDNLDVLFVPAHTLPVIRRPGLKTVVTVHDLGSEYLPGVHQLKQRLYLGFMQKFQLKGASKIIAVSKATKADLVKKLGIEPGKIEIIYEGYNKELFKSVKDDVLINTLRHYNLKPKTYFLFVGTVQPRKNLERLIRAFSKVVARHGAKKRSTSKSQSWSGSLVSLIAHQSTTNYPIDEPNFLIARDFATPTLVIVGSKGWLADEICGLPKKLGIEDKVRFLGYVPEEDLPVLYSGAIALTFPSLFEGFGLPILEAQACGCPVITSDVSSMPEVVGKGAILVNPYSVDDIVEGMIEVQSSKFKVQSLVEAGFKNIKRFSWEKCAAQTLEILESL